MMFLLHSHYPFANKMTTKHRLRRDFVVVVDVVFEEISSLSIRKKKKQQY